MSGVDGVDNQIYSTKYEKCWKTEKVSTQLTTVLYLINFLGIKLIGSIKGLSKDEEFDIKKSLRRIFTYVLLGKREWWRFRDEYLFSKGVLVVKDSYQTLIQKKVVNTLKTSFKHIFLQK